MSAFMGAEVSVIAVPPWPCGLAVWPSALSLKLPFVTMSHFISRHARCQRLLSNHGQKSPGHCAQLHAEPLMPIMMFHLYGRDLLNMKRLIMALTTIWMNLRMRMIKISKMTTMMIVILNHLFLMMVDLVLMMTLKLSTSTVWVGHMSSAMWIGTHTELSYVMRHSWSECTSMFWQVSITCGPHLMDSKMQKKPSFCSTSMTLRWVLRRSWSYLMSPCTCERIPVKFLLRQRSRGLSTRSYPSLPVNIFWSLLVWILIVIGFNINALCTSTIKFGSTEIVASNTSCMACTSRSFYHLLLCHTGIM